MRCPFLKEAHVKFCHNSAFRKMIVQTPGHADGEKCSSPDYTECPAYKRRGLAGALQAQCPFLQEPLVQYCSAASVTKYIPYSESPLGRCGSDDYRYCDLYLTMAHPGDAAAAATPSAGMCAEEPREDTVDGIRVPRWLWYSPNHMWLDVSADGDHHVGIDGFLAKALGHVDAISFVQLAGVKRPSVVLTVRGADLLLVFPSPLLLSGANLHLRADPAKLTSDPYSVGWLFKGIEAPGLSGCPDVREGLIPGDEAAEWMRDESDRLSNVVREIPSFGSRSMQGAPEPLLTDGGEFSTGVFQHLQHDQVLQVFNEFFSPYASWTRKR